MHLAVHRSANSPQLIGNWLKQIQLPDKGGSPKFAQYLVASMPTSPAAAGLRTAMATVLQVHAPPGWAGMGLGHVKGDKPEGNANTQAYVDFDRATAKNCSRLTTGSLLSHTHVFISCIT